MSAPARPPLTVLYLDVGMAWRGGQRQILWMGEGLASRGGRPIFALRPNAPLAARARERGIEVLEIDPAIAEWGPWTVLRLRRAVRRERISILHPQSGHTMALAALAGAGTGVRIVFARRTTFALRPNVGTRIKYRRADRVISVSRAGVDAMTRIGVDPGRIEVIPSGVPLDRLPAPAPRELLRSFGVPDDAPLAVMVGALGGVKDPITFVRAVARARERVPTLHALLVGDGPMRGAVESTIREERLADRCHMTGFRDDSERLLAAATVVVLSSRSEGTPGVLIDALALGKPIAAAAVGGVPEIVEDDTSGLLVPPGDAARLGNAIAVLIADSALATRLGDAARERARHFSIQATVERTIAVYEALLAEGR